MPHRLLVATAMCAALAVGATACERAPEIAKPSKAFCKAGKEYERRITAKKPPSIAEQVKLVERMAATAPADVKHDAEVFLDAMRKIEAGDTSVRNRPSVKRAVENVNRHYAQGCGLYKRQGPL
ncbi:MAG: hypothetical protein U0V73_04210 [Acidimicrobiia bacterium]